MFFEKAPNHFGSNKVSIIWPAMWSLVSAPNHFFRIFTCRSHLLAPEPESPIIVSLVVPTCAIAAVVLRPVLGVLMNCIVPKEIIRQSLVGWNCLVLISMEVHHGNGVVRRRGMILIESWVH